MNNFFDPIPETPQAAPLAARRADQVLSVPQVMAQTMGQVYAPELVPTDLLENPVQGPAPTLVGLSSFGACPTPTGEMFSVGVPVMSPQMFDSFGLPVPGGPASGLGFRVARSTATSKRYITNTHSNKTARLPYVSANQGGKAISVTGYGLVPWTDEKGVTHQPPGLRDPVVNKDTFDVLFDGKTIKLDASTNELYADILGLDAPGSASDTIPAGPITAGHAIIIIPGPGPSDPPTITMVAGSGIDQPASYVWAFSITRYGKETGLSPGQTGTTDGTHGHASIVLPALPTGDPATAYNLYRKDTAVGADGSIGTKFAYTSTTGAVLIGDPSTGAVAITSGPDSGLWIYKVLASNGNIHAGDEYLYNEKAYVVVGDPPVPIDPRDGSHLRLDVNANGDYAFVASDTGVFNAITGKITYPPGSPRNATLFKTVAAGLPAAAQTYVDSTPNASLGVQYARGQQTINFKPAAYSVAPYSGMTAIPGTSPALYQLSGVGFSDANPAVSNDGGFVKTKYGTVLDQEDNVSMLLYASATLPASGTGDQTARFLPGYDTNAYNQSAIEFVGAGNRFARVKIDGTTIKQTATGALMAVGGGGGGGGTGSAVAFSTTYNLDTTHIAAFTDGAATWTGAIDIDHGGFVAAGTDANGPNIRVPVAGTYGIACDLTLDLAVKPATTGLAELELYVNGSVLHYVEYDLTGVTDPTISITKLLDLVPTDTVQIRVYNGTSHQLDIELGFINLWLIESGFVPAVLRLEGDVVQSGSVANGSFAKVQWTTVDANLGGFSIASLTDITIPTTGEYDYSFSCEIGLSSTTAVGSAVLRVRNNGAYVMRRTFLTQTQEPTAPINVLDAIDHAWGFSATAGDVITFEIFNSTGTGLSIDGAMLQIARVG